MEGRRLEAPGLMLLLEANLAASKVWLIVDRKSPESASLAKATAGNMLASEVDKLEKHEGAHKVELGHGNPCSN